MPTSRLHDFQDLMRFRIQEILLVASPYDSFILEEDGQLSELVLAGSPEPAPGLLAVSSGAEALELAEREKRFDLIVITTHVGDLNAAELSQRLRQRGLDVPVVLLASSGRELQDFLARHGSLAAAGVEEAFVWQGDVGLLPAIVKCVEDRRNVEHDALTFGVQVILLIEDSVRYTSSFLPAIYTELMAQSQRLLSEAMNLSHKLVRLRARPKILLCRTYEDAWSAFRAYESEILGVISDVEFPRGGAWSAGAGADFARAVREVVPDVPVVLQSSRSENETLAKGAGAAFLLKGSPTLIHDLRGFMGEYFGFGEFIFRLPDGTEVDRARDMKALEEKLRTVPLASVVYHGERNHFSKWLKARTEFALAQKLRPRKVSEFRTHEDMRRSTADAIADYRREQNQVRLADFDRHAFEARGSFYRIGGGSIGGKARGLAFLRRLLFEQKLGERFPSVRIGVPEAVVLGTDVFERFLDENGLRDLAIHEKDDAEIARRFAEGFFPESACEDLAVTLEHVHHPLAVRSSSILEDSQYQPFTGVYETLLLANRGAGIEARLAPLLSAIKTVYASTFTQRAKAYLSATPYRLEEEKMAVIVQRLAGLPRPARAPERFYPDFAGVARSRNFYPLPPLTSSDGIVAVAVGLGKTVVEGGDCVRFSPRHPHHALVYSSPGELLDSAQREFWALSLDRSSATMREERFELPVAESDGVLDLLVSTYSEENDALYDGIARGGVRVVTFAPLLKHGAFPLAEMLAEVLRMGERGMSAPVEVEFAVSLGRPGIPPEFSLLQMRPLGVSFELSEVELEEVSPERVLCRSDQVMGHGHVEGIRDLVVVDFHRFERGRSREAAQVIAKLNALLAAEKVPYILVGVGRWGSRDPWLGIPVTWEQISGARVIVESGLKDMRVTPSQGSHFFQNLSSFNVGYFTVSQENGRAASVDWSWLDEQPAAFEAVHVRHIRLDRPLLVTMNGRTGEGVILKPG